ncbi:histidinol dehydrogenase [Saccharospirillum sp. MSK14-1]|uniref:histidinol dehydrogenase n=1 Tax=Saccharospirillum sp. MSK14-1 TaxID=1897632 RepID=UPI000D33A812|nr:histidinol dehydrogenase [Saccharospirillum sp. MSK14-1]PTY38872.1 histidinol dehydrogenase [Saccharospirillum sp. MSK14-1]
MSTLSLRRLDAQSPEFSAQLDQLLAWESVSDTQVQQRVADIIADIRARGDAALLELTARFDRFEVNSIHQLMLGADAIQAGFDRLPEAQQDALKTAAERVESYHQHQLGESWQYREANGTLLGQQVTSMDKVGIYVPGGTAPLASSVIMNAMPARVAGVREIVMTTPAPDGQVSDFVLGAAHVAGIDRIFLIGGAQAVAALAYGTETVPAVDKIVGPGNIYVATAKQQVFGKVGIDMIAGPSEILVVCDGKTDPDWIALDLFSQAEHDVDAQSILISQDGAFLDAVSEAIERLLPTLERADIVRRSLSERGALIQVADLADAPELINRIAPEHLELSVDDPESWLPSIRHAGAVFLGRHTPEALGDYCAGPNHVLPTSGTARFFSPLGVYDFQKRTSLIGVSPEGAKTLGAVASILARGEQLTAHARSAEKRLDD